MAPDALASSDAMVGGSGAWPAFRRPRPLATTVRAPAARRLLALVLVLAAGAACRGRRSHEPNTPLASPVGALPAGCGTAASVDRKALGSLGDWANGIVASAGVRDAALTGIDLSSSVHHLKYCKLSGAGGERGRGEFVLLMSGAIPPGALETISRGRDKPVTRDIIGGVSIIGDDRVWLAVRGTDPASTELVMASSRDLLRATLVGPATTYELDPGAPLSLVMAPAEVKRLLSGKAGFGPSPLAGVRRLIVKLAPGASELVAKFELEEGGTAQQLVAVLQPAIQAMARQAAAPGSSPLTAAVALEGEDVVARVALPPNAVEALVSRMTATAARRSRPALRSAVTSGL